MTLPAHDTAGSPRHGAAASSGEAPAQRPQNRAIDAYPLSATQRGMLFHSLLQPDSGVYVVQLAFTLRGPLDEAAFDAAWQGLAARHDVLRTAFAWEKLAAPLQVVGAHVRLPVRVDTLAAADADAAMREWMDADRRRGFRLSAAPLMRVQAFRLGDDVHRVICTHHHILLDGWSLPLLLRDWQALYAAARAGRAADLPPAPRFRSHIDWLARQDRAAALDFWRAELADVLPDRAREGMADIGASASTCTALTLSGVDSDAIHALARSLRITTGCVLQGAWAVLRARLTGRDDIVSGLTRSGRPMSQPGADATVGLYITTLPMRLRIDPRQPLADWLQSLQTRLLAQQAHEHLAQADLPDTRGLYDSIVVIENYPLGSRATDAEGLALCDVQVVEQTHHPLNLFALPGERIELKLLHDAQRLDMPAARDMLDRLAALLRQFCARPEAALHRFDACADAATLQSGLSLTAARRPTQSAGQRIALQAAAQPAAIAVQDAQGAIDYATLYARAGLLASRLHALDIGRGDVVAICCRRTRELPLALLAVMRAGATWLPLDPAMPPARLRDMIEDSGARAVLQHAATADLLPFWRGARVDIDDAGAVAPVQAVSREASHGDDAAYLIYTSGSTGRPKGVLISQTNLANLLQGMQERLSLTAAPHWLAVTSPSFDIAMLELLLPLYCGGRVFVADEDTVRDGHRLGALLEREALTHMQATPAGWRLLLAAGWRGRRGLTALCGGEALDSALARDLLARVDALWNVYGPTETTIWSAALRMTPDLLTGTQAPIGQALANTSLHVVDAQGRPVPPGEAGELLIGGLGVSPGYHRRPALTAERFVPAPLAPPSPRPDSLTISPRVYRTGDRVRLRSDGLLDCLGRDDRQVKLRGYRIELDEIEARLRLLPGVDDAAVVLQGEGDDARLVAFHTGLASEAALRADLAEQLPPWMVPSRLQALPALPQTTSGKTDRRALQSMQASPAAAQQDARGDTERQLLALWRSVLGRDDVGVHDNFFDAGGHSLLALSVQGRLKTELGLELPLVDLFRLPTVAALARHVDAQRTASAAQADPAGSDDARLTGRQRLARRRMQQAAGTQVNG
ncbi:non-ribosomal peptide synthetase [Methyloversatilis thermotolerans]|uniref:non-ribosomal peptide synthetase n=1 Tax=Methyloversatilis thermotolerans TaxID=1346290 RepID=UPI0003763ECD|nr:non-ribosomal peptide synthetase [Methyloversatilis thermotolerans]